MKITKKIPKILLFDVETAPIIAYVWGLWDQNVGLNQIKSDWHLLSWAAKWLDEMPVMYMDQRNEKNIENDKHILQELWKLLDAADIVIAQNGVHFDKKKINARFILNGMKPPKPYKVIDTLLMAKKHFGFTSNKLEYLSDKLSKKNKKLTKRKFAGFDLWKECLAGNRQAWNEMEKYNKLDVLSLEEVYKEIYPWDNSINFNMYIDKNSEKCQCGSTSFQRRGYHYTATSKFQQYCCNQCGAWSRGKENLLAKDKRKNLRVKIA